MGIHVEYTLSQALVAGGQTGMMNTCTHIDVAASALAALPDDSARIAAVIGEITKRVDLLAAYEGGRARGNLAAQLAVLARVVKGIPVLAADLSIEAKFRIAAREMPGIRESESRPAGISARAAA
jgi:hypothetical protein